MGAGEIVGIYLYVLAFVLNIIAIGTPAWIINNTLLTSSGLLVVASDNESTTVNREAAENWALSCSIIGDILLVFAIVVTGNAYESKLTGMKVRLGGIIGLMAALFFMIGMSAYTGMRRTEVDFEFIFWGYSFVLGWLSFCHALIGGICATMIRVDPGRAVPSGL